MHCTYKHLFRSLAAGLLALSLGSCRMMRSAVTVERIDSIRLVGSYVVPHKMTYAGTTVGGLSGIDYDPRLRQYYLICDDRSALNPARFYTASIAMGARDIDSVVFTNVTYLRQPNGHVYPNNKQDALHVPDPESMRWNPRRRRFVWGSEGERIVKPGETVIEDPSIISINSKGLYLDSFALPANMHMSAEPHGPRQNGVFEGMTFIDNYRRLLVNVEEPIYEDGPRAGLGDSTGWIRLIDFDVATRRPLHEYGYQIDPVPYPPTPTGAFKINGVPDILAINNHQLLVIERAFSTGRRACSIRLYIGDLDEAENIAGRHSLRDGSFRPVRKRLLFDMDRLGRYIDNVEGVTFGPVLPNGHRSLVLVADDNFDPNEENQFFLFEIL